jgi:hypothetical protein
LSGVTFELLRDGQPVPDDQRGTPYFIIGSTPIRVPGATETRPPNYGGFANVTPGTYSVIASKGGREAGRIDGVAVVGGALSQVIITPRPRD